MFSLFKLCEIAFAIGCVDADSNDAAMVRTSLSLESNDLMINDGNLPLMFRLSKTNVSVL